jgi:adenylate cyclase
MPLHPKPAASIRRLTTLYVGSLTAVAILALTGQYFIQQQLARQSFDVRIVSTAQNRQTLCQRLIRAALAVQVAQDEEDKQQSLADLRQTVEQWEKSRGVLVQEMRTTLSAAEMAELKPILARLEPEANTLLETAKAILVAHSEASRPLPDRATVPESAPSPQSPSTALAQSEQLSPEQLSPEQLSPEQSLLGQRPLEQLPVLPKSPPPNSALVRGGLITRHLAKAERAFISGTDEVIAWYNQEATQGVTKLRQLEVVLLSITLMVLLLEGVMIFRPAVQQLQQTMVALSKALQETQETAAELAAEQEKSERLLLNMLPSAIADRLKQEPQAIADGFSEVTVLFADIVGFTELSSRLTPRELVARLNDIFSRFDALVEQHDLEKIKTIGDAYMVVGGLPKPRADHAEAIASLALAIQQEIEAISDELGESFTMRMGINSGPVIAGVIGTKKFIYDLWGDTVNIASRMESHGLEGCIQVTADTYQRLKHTYEFKERGIVPIKGKGNMRTYWLLAKVTAPVAVL